jgi:hypothetical protein
MKLEYKKIPFEIKAEDVSDEGVFTGYGSTFGGKPDSHGDVIRQGAFKESIANGGRNGTGVVLLYQHRSDEPIGVWEELVENSKGLKVQGQLNLEVQRAREAHSLLKQGALKGLSIGFDIARDDKGNRLEDAVEWDDKKGIRFLNKLDLWEISIVTFPSNIRASVTNVKSIIEEAKNERELEMALRDECSMTVNAAKYIVGLCKEKAFARGNFLTDEELQMIVDEKVNLELGKKHTEELLNKLKKIR